MFNKILIANRGEIACRVIKTARRMGIRTVAVYSEADANARHVRFADEAVLLGPAAARESYLVADRILDAARRTGAQAVHPGYGFLSENADFSEACAANGITFIGPPASAIRAMGSKSEAKKLMGKAAVPLTPGYHGDDQDPAWLHQQADAIGYPVLIKAAAGGGGKGMRLVASAGEFAAAFEGAKREAGNAFGDDTVYIEKAIIRPRHIEIQVFGDTHGHCVSLFERDCSVQRRNQKVIEETPAPNFPAKTRAALLDASLRLMSEAKYRSAGTVEFLYDGARDEFAGGPQMLRHALSRRTSCVPVAADLALFAGCRLVEARELTQRELQRSQAPRQRPQHRVALTRIAHALHGVCKSPHRLLRLSGVSNGILEGRHCVS